MIKILCELEANPHNVTFNWKFNASATEFLDLPASQIFPERNNAVAQYTPMTEHVSTVYTFPFFFCFIIYVRLLFLHYIAVANHIFSLSSSTKPSSMDREYKFYLDFFCVFFLSAMARRKIQSFRWRLNRKMKLSYKMSTVVFFVFWLKPFFIMHLPNVENKKKIIAYFSGALPLILSHHTFGWCASK